MNPLGSSKEIVQNKLIIMYIMHGLNMPVSNNHITKLVLETRMMNYFMFQQCFNELHEGKLLELAGTSGKPAQSGYTDSYVLTENGNNTLRYFLNLISPGVKKQLDKIAPAARNDIRNETFVTADFIPESEDKFTVNCKIDENGFRLMELKAAVGTKKDARNICDNWKNHSAEIYAEIVEALTKKRG